MLKSIRVSSSNWNQSNNCFILDNGDVLTINEKKLQLLTRFNPEIFILIQIISILIIKLFAKENSFDDGMVSIIFSSKNNKLNKVPNIISRGFIYVKGSTELMEEIQKKSQDLYETYYRSTKRFNQNHLANYISNALTDFIYEKTEKKPMIVPIFMKY